MPKFNDSLEPVIVSGMAPLAISLMVGIHFPHGLGKLVVLILELVELHGAILVADAPRFVADAPELDVIRLGMAVGGAQFAHRRGGVAVGSIRPYSAADQSSPMPALTVI